MYAVPARRTLPASALLTVYLLLLTVVPAGLVFPALGAAGTPATVFGIFLLIWWIGATLARQKPDRGASPARIALGLLAVSAFLSFACGLAYGWVQPADIHEVTDGVWSLVPVRLDELQQKSVLAGVRGLLTVAGWLGVALVTCD